MITHKVHIDPSWQSRGSSPTIVGDRRIRPDPVPAENGAMVETETSLATAEKISNNH